MRSRTLLIAILLHANTANTTNTLNTGPEHYEHAFSNTSVLEHYQISFLCAHITQLLHAIGHAFRSRFGGYLGIHLGSPCLGESLLGGGFCLGESLTEQTPLLHPYLGKEARRALPPHEHSPDTARTHTEHKSRRKGRKRLKHSRAGKTIGNSRAGNTRELETQAPGPLTFSAMQQLHDLKHSRAENSSARHGYHFRHATVTQSEALESWKLKRRARLRFLPRDSYTI